MDPWAGCRYSCRPPCNTSACARRQMLGRWCARCVPVCSCCPRRRTGLHSIQQGMLLDSDVFSIIIDPNRHTMVYVSACSGIYKSVNAGNLFTRIKGIPHSAIRTRVLKQDPKRPGIVYAGTTGGLWKTFDGGTTWELYSAPPSNVF